MEPVRALILHALAMRLLPLTTQLRPQSRSLVPSWLGAPRFAADPARLSYRGESGLVTERVPLLQSSLPPPANLLWRRGFWTRSPLTQLLTQFSRLSRHLVADCRNKTPILFTIPPFSFCFNICSLHRFQGTALYDASNLDNIFLHSCS